MALTVLDGKLPLTDKCHHYDTLGEVPWDIQKYMHIDIYNPDLLSATTNNN